ncbi:hypothetical protein [Nocardia brevicatena]|uniref:hypothetical protein n=1 Tax=Nocardia brevicatena TaxID=37327 RepID=UPI0006857EF3|nr:hypothetical protein [Nocardia brevicatena]
MNNSSLVKYAGPGGEPGSPLAVVRAGFDRIAAAVVPADPRPVPTTGAATGSPIRTWDELRERLWDQATPIEEIDAIWVWLLERVRAEADDAMLVCAGLAAPMLARSAGKYAALGSGHRHDIESEVLAGFLARLGDVNVDRPGLWHRLRWVAYRATRKAANQQQSLAASVGDLEDDLGPLALRARSIMAGPGHPDTVLAHAVAAGVISEEESELIAASRWEKRTLTTLAAERGVSVWKLRKARPRAERALAAWLSERLHDLDPERTSTVEAEAVTALTPPAPSPRRGRRPNRHTPAQAQSSTYNGQEAAA